MRFKSEVKDQGESNDGDCDEVMHARRGKPGEE